MQRCRPGSSNTRGCLTGESLKWVGSFWFSFKATQAPKQGDPLLRRHAHADQSKRKTFGGPRPFESQSKPGQLGKGQSQELGADAFVVHYIGCYYRVLIGTHFWQWYGSNAMRLGRPSRDCWSRANLNKSGDCDSL